MSDRVYSLVGECQNCLACDIYTFPFGVRFFEYQEKALYTDSHYRDPLLKEKSPIGPGMEAMYIPVTCKNCGLAQIERVGSVASGVEPSAIPDLPDEDLKSTL